MRKLLSRLFLCTLILLFTTHSLWAQIAVMRNYFPAPLEDTTYEKGFFGKLAFSAEGSRGFGSALGEQAWNIKYIGFVELYRFSANAAIAGSLAHEFTANPHNEISFHMRGAIWNETLAYFHKLKPVTLEAGITHHCRHEIDNSIPADEREIIPNYIPTRRLIVLTSPYISVQSNWLEVEKLQARFYSRLNLYTYAVDGRRPTANMEQSLDYVRASALIGARINYLPGNKFQLYARGFYNPVYFIEDTPFKNNFRMEAGGAVLGKKGNFELFAAYEHFFDDMSRPYPLSSNVASIGIRGRSPVLF
jgi:hypothetical protein